MQAVPTVQELRAWAEGVKGPSRDLDAAVCLSLGWTRRPSGVKAMDRWIAPDGLAHGYEPPAVSRSVDAILGVVEGLLAN